MADNTALKIDVRREGETTILGPHGEIDLSCAPSFREQIKSAQSGNPKRLVVDLGQVPYMDSSGVATLVEAMQQARKTNTRLVLCALQEKVLSIFEIARLNEVFTIVKTEGEALNA